MDHPTFPKIATTLQHSSGGASDWVATEKVHGAQLVVAHSAQGVQIGKRKAWLGEDDAFFGWQLIAPGLQESAKGAAAALNCEKVVIYGELCGGAYPHPDVVPVPGLTAVQTGVWYAADLRYVVFDIRVYAPAKGIEETESTFLSHDEVVAVCEASSLATVPLLGRGRRSALQQLPVRFPSTVPALFGLPPIDGNCAEGFVLKPAARVTAANRPIVKYKIPEFDDAKFDESIPFNPDAQLTIAELMKLCDSLTNPARVASARSKVGTEPGAVRDEVILDVLVDLERVFPRRMAILTEPESSALQQHLAELASGLVS